MSAQTVFPDRVEDAALTRRSRPLYWRVRGYELAILGAVIILVLVVLAIFGPHLAPYDPYKLNFREKLQPPSQAHWFGTDEAGRDIFSRIIYGTRISLRVAAIIVVIATVVGVPWGDHRLLRRLD
jgi:peptide/nickel transport system permease protein